MGQAHNYPFKLCLLIQLFILISSTIDTEQYDTILVIKQRLAFPLVGLHVSVKDSRLVMLTFSPQLLSDSLELRDHINWLHLCLVRQLEHTGTKKIAKNDKH